MKKLLGWLVVGTVVGLGIGSRVTARPDDGFGQFRTTPLAAPTPGLPTGIEPDRIAPSRTSPAVPVAAPNPFPLPVNGRPWMICAATYLGADGAELARQLTLELRDKHKLKGTYIFNRGDEERRQQEAEWQERLKNAHGAPIRRKRVLVVDQYAVLIDGFPDLASATAYLPKIKALPLPTLKLESSNSPYDTMLIPEYDKQLKKMVTKRTNVNPFHNALVVRNPALGTTTAARSKFDPFWKELNSGVSHCVLDNPKKYTLLVKEYTGARVVQSGMQTSGFLSALGGGNNTGDSLDAAGKQAQELVRVLRSPQLGFQAWVLHTRQVSAVFIGGFDGMEDPELQRVQRQLNTLKFTSKQGGADPIGLMPNPILVEVPRP